ncbi:MAG: tetratricopeptide repeat protein, partial [Planctomycetes bacterium]|nr:tetratricopeptide repeat protein [Planctomycetota bacterium]
MGGRGIIAAHVQRIECGKEPAMATAQKDSRFSNDPRTRINRGPAPAPPVLLLVAVLLSSLPAQEETAGPVPRFTLAVPGFENRTGDPDLAHWSHGAALLRGSLREVQAVRVLSEGATRYALGQVGLRAGDPIDPNTARRMGESIEAQRVLWGYYTKKADRWRVAVRVLNVATGAVSAELAAEASDWFEIRDRLTEQVLTELSVIPTAEEREKMAQRWTRSTEALDWYLQGGRADEQGKPAAEVEALLRRALGVDPNGALAYCSLAGALATQGQLDGAEETARRALDLKSDSARAHYVLGWVHMIRNQLGQAEAELRRASQLDPQDADYLVDLARICLAQRKGEEATALLEKAVTLDRTAAAAHAALANAYVLQKRPNDAVRELAEARRYLPAGVHGANALSSIAVAYGMLGRRSEALEYYERTLPLARELGANPNMIRLIENRIQQIRSTLTPTFIQAAPPRRYTEEELNGLLQQKLTDDERRWTANPFSCTEAMRQWARELTQGVDTDLNKAKAIFEELAARLFDPGGRPKNRTAREVFDAWKDPKVCLMCADHAVL